ncbi:MAG TPA: DUF6152 family protein [Vicinamibacterales bacterium]|nr:DUF6152 family protein [Vicinamibacterales bacterium]
MRRLSFAPLVAVLALWPAAASAHHGIINFDLNREVDIAGVVTRLAFVNPHAWLYIDVTNENGRVTAWKCELRGATVLRRSGWSPEMFARGTRLRITGAPDRFEPNTCYLGSVVFENGTRIDRYGQITRPAASTAAAAVDRPLRLPNGQPNITGEWAGEQRVLTDPRGISGAFLPLSVAKTLDPGAVPEGTQAFPGTRGTAVARAENPVDTFWNQRPSARPLTAEGAKAIEGFDGASADNPRLRCEPTSILFDWTFESDVNRIVQENDRITLRYGSMGLERTIHLNVSEHPTGVALSRAGHSIGRWENDVLIVDTVGFEPGILSADGRLPHSNRLHVVERFSLDPAGRTLTRRWAAEDPLYFEGQYSGADAVTLSDVPYQQTPCEDLSFKSSGDGTEGTARVILWGAVGLMGALLIGWTLKRRLRPRAV